MEEIWADDWGVPCCFCGRGVKDSFEMSAGPTTDYPTCCPPCYDKHVVDHLHPKRDILK